MSSSSQSFFDRLQNDVCFSVENVDGQTYELHCPFMVEDDTAEDVALLTQLMEPPSVPTTATAHAARPTDMEDLASVFLDRFCSTEDECERGATASTDNEMAAAAAAAAAETTVVRRPKVVKRPAAKRSRAASPELVKVEPFDDMSTIVSRGTSPVMSRPDSPASTDDPAQLQKRRNCEASARYRRRKQTELESLRQQYLETYNEKQRLEKRIGILETQNKLLLERAEAAEHALKHFSSNNA